MPARTLASDAQFMRQALELAAQGRGTVEPNPMVGCVIVRDGRVIGRGFHERFGGPHAEPIALADCRESPAGATAYVTLEPCCHTDKKTPPCVPRLIEAKVARVVVGCEDPNPQVAGRGTEQLRAAGIDVTLGVLENECRQLNAPFFALTRERRPYVTLKWAQSADGTMAGPPGQRLWISNSTSQQTVHEFRAMCDAILVGINTVLCDDPLLTVRGVEPKRTLTRVVLNRNLTIPVSSRLVQSAKLAPVLVYCSSKAAAEKPQLVQELARLGLKVIPLPHDEPRGVSLPDVLRNLGSRAFTHLLVEPGPTLAASFLAGNLADRIWVYQAPRDLGEHGAPKAPAVTYPTTGEIDLHGDTLTEYLNPASPCFFTIRPSPELQRLRSK